MECRHPSTADLRREVRSRKKLPKRKAFLDASCQPKDSDLLEQDRQHSCSQFKKPAESSLLPGAENTALSSIQKISTGKPSGVTMLKSILKNKSLSHMTSSKQTVPTQLGPQLTRQDTNIIREEVSKPKNDSIFDYIRTIDKEIDIIGDRVKQMVQKVQGQAGKVTESNKALAKQVLANKSVESTKALTSCIQKKKQSNPTLKQTASVQTQTQKPCLPRNPDRPQHKKTDMDTESKIRSIMHKQEKVSSRYLNRTATSRHLNCSTHMSISRDKQPAPNSHLSSGKKNASTELASQKILNKKLGKLINQSTLLNADRLYKASLAKHSQKENKRLQKLAEKQQRDFEQCTFFPQYQSSQFKLNTTS